MWEKKESNEKNKGNKHSKTTSPHLYNKLRREVRELAWGLTLAKRIEKFYRIIWEDFQWRPN